MNAKQEIAAAVEFVQAMVEQQGHIMADQDNCLYFVEAVIVVEDQVIIIANGGRLYHICVQGTQFFIKGEFGEPSNDSKFWCICNSA